MAKPNQPADPPMTSRHETHEWKTLDAKAPVFNTDQNDFHACCGHEILSDLGEEKEPSPFRDRAIDIGFKAVGYLPGAFVRAAKLTSLLPNVSNFVSRRAEPGGREPWLYPTIRGGNFAVIHRSCQRCSPNASFAKLEMLTAERPYAAVH